MNRLPVAVHGATGRMGRLVVDAILGSPDLHLVDAWSATGHGADVRARHGGAPVGVPLTPAGPTRAAVIVDFSTPAALLAALPHWSGRPLVSGTTGLDATTEAALATHAQQAPVCVASNFSNGVAVLTDLVARATAALPDYDVEIVEAHHRGKRDAPSGTALRLAEAVEAGRRPSTHGRSGVAPRVPGEIGIHAVRGGDIIGEHEVWICGPGERLRLGHIATDRATFAHGALRVARRLTTLAPGRYAVGDLLT